MEFGRKLLTKFGWQEGKGLGKSEDGMIAPLKPKLKFDSAGIGFDYSKEYVNDWWAQGYNEALNSVNVSKKQKKRKYVDEEEQNKKDIHPKKSKQFIKGQKECLTTPGERVPATETLLQDGSHVPETDACQSDENDDAKISMDFEQLFEICGGRTAHKGARHGLGLSGKLARLEAQEKGLKLTSPVTLSLESSELDSNITETSADVAAEKKKKRKEKFQGSNINEADTLSCSKELFSTHLEEVKEIDGIFSKRRKQNSSKKDKKNNSGCLVKVIIDVSSEETKCEALNLAERNNFEPEITNITQKSQKKKGSKSEKTKENSQDLTNSEISPDLANQSKRKKKQKDLEKVKENNENLGIDSSEIINKKKKKKSLSSGSNDMSQEISLIPKSKKKKRKD